MNAPAPAPTSAPVSAPPATGAPSGSPIDPAAFTAALQAAGYKTTPTGGSSSGDWFSQIKPPAAAPSTVSERVSGDIQQAGKDVNAAISGEGQYAGENPIVRGVEAAGAAAGAIPKVAADILPTPLRTVANAALNAPAELANWLGEKIGNTQAAQDFVKNHPDAANALVEAAKVGSSLGTIAGTVLGAKGTAEGARVVSETAPKVAGEVGQGMKAMVTKTPAETAASNAKGLQSIADAWRKPTEVNNASFNKARAIMDKNPNIPQALANAKINPWEHTVDGKFDAASMQDTADALRAEAGKASATLLRPSLEAADKTTPKTPVDQIVNDTIAKVKSDRGLTASDRQSVINQLQKEGELLKQEHSGGMSLTDMHDAKITYAKNGGYSPTRSVSDNNTATANRMLASTLQHSVEKGAPNDLVVQEFNKELSNYYDAANYLESLANKKAPVSKAEYYAHKAAQLGGVVTGHALGGGILTDVIGYQVGGHLEKAILNMTTKARGILMDKLQTTNPAAFDKVSEFLAKNGLENPPTPQVGLKE